jgi:hypothetical protein
MSEVTMVTVVDVVVFTSVFLVMIITEVVE